MSSFVTPCMAAHQAFLSITNSQSLLKLMSIKSVIPSNHLILCRLLLLLPSTFPSIRMSQLFASVGQSIGASALASVFPMNIQDWYPLGWTGWISLLAKVLSRASVLRCSAFFIVQVSHPYMTTGKTIALTRWTLVGKVISLIFNLLSRLSTPFLPRSKHLLISWLRSPSAVILEAPKIKSVTVSIVSPSICHEVMGCHDLSFLNVEF